MKKPLLKEQNLKKFVLNWLLSFLFLSVFLGACASSTHSPSHPTRSASETRPAPVLSQPASNENPTPEREASQGLVDEGVDVMKGGRYDQASDLFQQAITLDATNGQAYYYLAFVKYQSGEYGDAANFLDKAQVSLKNSPDWMDKIAQLKRDLSRP